MSTGGPGGHTGGNDEFNAAAPLGVRVPDDLSELDADVRAYRRELAHGRRSAWWRSRLLTRRWQRYGLSGPLVALALVLVAAVGSLMAVLHPRFTALPSSQPLARPTRPVGQAGGLLPETSLSVRGQLRPTRDLRPAVLAVVPADCGCDQAVRELVGQSLEFRLPIYLLGQPAEQERLGELSRRVSSGLASVTLDSGGEVLAAVRPAGLTAVLVHSDGVLEPVQRRQAAGLRLEIPLAGLAVPGAARSATMRARPAASSRP